MADDIRSDAGTAAHRGFLFSDMRGFTAFAERHGNAAAAEAVSRFLELARTAIARHEGAELKTEGDAIHAVFPSASSAVMCGLDIVDAAAERNEREPDRPLSLGVGVHTGEAVETAEGYIGSAVNLAARLCAVARPGEVLVTSTVKSDTQTTIPVGFIRRGRQRLKGISDPVEVYAVTRDLTARAAVVMPRLGMFLALLGAAGVFLVSVIGLGGSIQGIATPSASPVAAATPEPVPMGPLAIGTYTPQSFQPRLTFEISDTGWSANRDVPGLLGLVRESPPAGSLFLARVQAVITDPCVQGGEAPTGPAPADVLGQLQGLAHLDVANRRVTQVGGWRGEQADITVADAALAACGGLVGLEVGMFSAGGEIWSATPGETFRVIVVRQGDEAVTIVISLDWAQSHSVQELEQLYALGGRILTGVEFLPRPG